MSVQTLYTAATGMEAMETKLDVIANNLANVNTTAYKAARANFEDLFYRQEVMPGTTDESGGITATGTAVGLGAAVSSTQTDFRQGAFWIRATRWMWPLSARDFFRCKTWTVRPSTVARAISASIEMEPSYWVQRRSDVYCSRT